MTAEIALRIVIILVLLVWLALSKANRLDLLHQKVAKTGATLNAQLLRRAGLAAELAVSGYLDPASSLIVAEAADVCLTHDGEDADSLGLVESELSRALRQAVEGEREGPDPDAPRLVQDVMQAWKRVGLARRFHNDAVAQVRRMRAQGIVRILHLAGRAEIPATFEMDDAPPRGWWTS